MQVVIRDDGKERDQSFEATIELSDSEYEGSATFTATGYGSSEIEARSNLLAIVMRMHAQIGQLEIG
ncbi:hypothetical protein EVB94_083 [Rhizobium phage RHph_TM40]|uniref:Uncharacterized protein n=2 Tax=Cuauhnahuacvirus TaxID=3044696 RepID=A0A7S5UXA2_9CAUD|nr:hypothetical protein PQC16_gp083 [Rhizobium phage RHph_TM30]YP_010671230.1 hypothetical protein PQC17_gp081 [Rhizobium phage RHph_Y65]QIG71554.1 hypothetical protein EVB94_083 [Rhizobium phage RHph_TM40]QIG71917.1 hypothetical protein EVB95_083 [Rhizobium phage RHph_TM2_3B]QIG72279.1 hypothetical protein EVB96_083 [Rhizobium phage RHph_TM3_3_6]QIG71190.1 hypothetical protein EVB93_083 [Rhizobium phage RHph_TM30]QIG72639.1 hypothetical protein EVB97_081 [Rhizobium phage RHph_Y65]